MRIILGILSGMSTSNESKRVVVLSQCQIRVKGLKEVEDLPKAT